MNTTIHFRLIASQSIFHYFSFWQYNFNSAIFQIELYISKQTQVDFSYDNCNQYTKHIYLHSVNLNSSSKKGKPHRYAYAETLISNLIACGAFSSVQLLSRVRLFTTPRTAAQSRFPCPSQGGLGYTYNICYI